MMLRPILVVLVVLARTAAADDGRLAAEQLAKEAEATKDEGKLVACGKAYLDLYNKDPARPDGDELLYNSAVCYVDAHSVSTSILTWDLLLRSYPRSKLAGKALQRSGMAYLSAAMLDRAAERFEDYAKRYAGEKDARDALENAITLRGALGDREQRIADSQLYVRIYGLRSPKDAASAMFALTTAYDTPAQQVKALREYVATWGGKGSREQLAQAFQRLGDALWRQSCPVTLVDGLCAKVAHDKAQRCSATAVRLDSVARAPALRKDALAAYDQAIKVVTEAGLTDPAAVHAAALARLAHADDLLERMLAKPFPAGFDVKRFSAWLTETTKAGETANQAYGEVLAMKDASASIAAAARLGQLNDLFSTMLVAGEIPAAVRTGAHAADKIQAYCDQMTATAEPLHQHAQEGYSLCTEKAAELGVFDEWTALCRRETHTTIAEIQPDLTLAIPLAGDDSPGEKAWRAGRRDEAMQDWQDALHANGKLYAAHLDLAIAELEKLRGMARTDPARKPLAADAGFQARSALAIRYDALPYVVLAMLALEDNQLDLASGMVDQPADTSALLWSARAVVAARRGDWTRAHQAAEAAVTADPKSEVALRTSGLVAAHVGLFDIASKRLAAVKERSYDVVVARAIAARGLGDKHAAEALYQQAIHLDPGGTEAKRDLELLQGR